MGGLHHMADFWNYLTSSLKMGKRFAGQALDAINKNIPEDVKEFVGPAYDRTKEYFTTPSYKKGKVFQSTLQSASERTEGFLSDILKQGARFAPLISGETQSKGFSLQNPYLLARRAGERIGGQLHLDDEYKLIGGTAIGAGILGMSGVFGNPLEGLRPPGQKAVYPVSKEEDPTGRQTKNPLIETAARYFGEQKGQPLSYQAFKEDRPDVMPSTYSDFLRYQYSKPDPGDLIKIDKE